MTNTRLNDDVISVNSVVIGFALALPIGTFVFAGQRQVPVNLGGACVLVLIWHKLLQFVSERVVSEQKAKTTPLKFAPYLQKWTLLTVVMMLVHGVLSAMVGSYPLIFIIIALFAVCIFATVLSSKLTE